MKTNQPNTVILAFKNEVVADVFALAFEGVLHSRVISCSDAYSVAKALEEYADACVIVEATFPEASLHQLIQRQVAFAKRATIFLVEIGRAHV